MSVRDTGEVSMMVHENIHKGKPGKRVHRRIRGVFSGKTGKAVGLSSLAAPVVSWIVYDLRKPNSVIRTVLTHTVKRLLSTPSNAQQALDITDKVEISKIEKHEHEQ